VRAGHSTGPRHGREHARAGKRAGPWQPAAAACAQAAFDCPHALPHGQYCERHRARPAAPHPTGSQPGVRAKRSEEEEEEERLREPRAKRARARRAHACHGPARTPTAARQQQHYPRWPAPACAARSPAACSPSCPLPQRKLLREVTVFLIGGSILRRRLACVRRRVLLGASARGGGCSSGGGGGRVRGPPIHISLARRRRRGHAVEREQLVLVFAAARWAPPAVPSRRIAWAPLRSAPQNVILLAAARPCARRRRSVRRPLGLRCSRCRPRGEGRGARTRVGALEEQGVFFFRAISS